MIASKGYMFVPQCIDDKALHALRAEADSLFNLKRSNCELSEDEYFDKVSEFRHKVKRAAVAGCTLRYYRTSHPQSRLRYCVRSPDVLLVAAEGCTTR